MPDSRRLTLIRVSLILLVLVVLGLWYLNFPIWGVGIFLLLLSSLVVVLMIELFFRSYYYRNIITNNYSGDDLFSFTVGRILLDAKEASLLPALFRASIGRRLFSRLGIPEVELTSLSTVFKELPSKPLTFPTDGILRLRFLMQWLWSTHNDFRGWLQSAGVREGDLLSATDWLVRDIENSARRERFWSRQILEQIPGLAQNWSYGGAYTLANYSRDLTAEVSKVSSTVADANLHSIEIEQVETILYRSREANVLVIGESYETEEAVLWQLATRIVNNQVVPFLRNKRLVLLNTSLLLASFKERADFERELLKIFNEAVQSGNILLAIDNLAVLLRASENFGVDFASLIDPYLSSGVLSIIALTNRDYFNHLLGSQGALLERFEQVSALTIDYSRLITFLEDLAEEQERHQSIFFTYQAIEELARGAEQYFQSESLTNKASDLLIEIVPWAIGRRQSIVSKALVLDFIKSKTNIPVGEINLAERQQLLSLESLLAKRVIGQTQALTAIATTLRRARTGLRNPKRPMGSFLFLGSTGVGKTETAKALAEVFFDQTGALLRLDMSEYQTIDSLDRLIGSFTAKRPGTLSAMVQEHPYGVLLLDEFEKARPEVLNLFLQILDEGFFSDATGRRINVRNLMIIATSNAGAEFIWNLLDAGRDPTKAKEEIIKHLVSQALLKPELLNRFDELIIFHPLSDQDLRQIARLLLERLAKRLEERGLTLLITDPLLARVVADGADRHFGARPMQRYIQDQVEERIAQAMIRGEVASGQKLEFNDKLELRNYV